jgi:hypothetical protein
LKHKHIKGVAHNLGHSFLSDTNALMRNDVYTIVPALLFQAATQKRVPFVQLDILQKTVNPPELNSSELRQSLDHFQKWLPNLLASHQIEPAIIRSATLRIEFDYTRTRRTDSEPSEEIPEFRCMIELTDDRGVTHTAEPKNWWRS